MANDIISIIQLPIIEEQLQTIKMEIESRVADVVSLACTPETVKSIKNERAKLNKELKDWEEKRKVVKDAIMNPYNQFEVRYKECISEVYKKADAGLKGKIDSVEDELKQEKETEIIDYFNEYCLSKNIDFVGFNRTSINVTLSASIKSLKEQAKEFIDRVCGDLALIETQEHKDEILYEYKQSLNVSSAITTVVNRYNAIEEIKRKNEMVEEIKTVKIEVAKKVDELLPPTEEEPAITVAFTVTATKTKLKELKEFLNDGGYDYE